MANKFFKDSKVNVEKEDETKLLNKIVSRYHSAFNAKMELMDNLEKFQAYWEGDVNKPEDENDPGSEVNIIQPIIESQVAELVDGQKDILVKGVGPSDQPFAQDVQHILNYVWRKNKMIEKLDEGERDRLNQGTSGWKVFWDGDLMRGRGLPAIEPRNIEFLFPDPRVKHPRKLNDGDFFIEVIPMTTTQAIRQFGDRARLIKPGGFSSYDPRIFGDNESVDEVTRDQVKILEYWEKDEKGNLRRVYCSEDMILDDSFKDKEHESFYKHAKFPYVLIPCYLRKGTVWGMGDTEQLIPIQDMINDMDDQIRLNARLTGNNQTVVGTGSGINIRKWDSTPGLKIPAKDFTAWKPVVPYPLPNYISARRDKGFQESEIVSGRSDITEGRRSGSLRAASAILAMQEAGSRRANHKKLMNEQGFGEVLELVLEYIKEFMTTEQAFDLTEKDNTEYLWFRGSDLNHIPWKSLNENFDPTSDAQGTDLYKDLYEEDEEGNAKLMTKDAEFDLEISLGAGMPNNKSFLYQSTIELMRENIITQEEARACLKQLLNWPIIDPYKPEGTFAGRNSSEEQLNIANQVPVEPEVETEQTPEQVVPPTQNPQIQMILQQALADLPPEQAQALMGMLGGMPQ